MGKVKVLIRVLISIFIITGISLVSSCSAKKQKDEIPEIAKIFGDAGLRLFKDEISSINFSLPALDGENISLKQLEGKVVFLNFWATWCGPCRSEMPSMEALYLRHKNEGFEILAVNCMENQTDVDAFMKEYELSFPAVLDEAGIVSASYGIQAFPTTYLLNRKGKIILRVIGSINWDTPEINKAIEYLINS
jgi:thiol-disulfide isomerase/thioredoxin